MGPSVAIDTACSSSFAVHLACQSLADGRMSSRARSAGGASIRREPGTSAAGCASHVGYQNERISRRA
ncbi:MAG: hypothetical protein DMD95_04575 [Candidatus Rokuibacteriota bacterium]|nr:MAG: hypothetical protein DMD95_04575 [Candidatus Rokubacteria bacterium]